MVNNPIKEKYQNEFDDLKQRGEYHANMLKKTHTKYLVLAWIFNLAIPLLSISIATIPISDNKRNFLISILAIIVAVLSVLNSVIDPREKYLTLGKELIALDDWLRALSITWIAMEPKNEEEISQFLLKNQEEMSKLATQMMETCVPNAAREIKASTKADKGDNPKKKA